MRIERDTQADAVYMRLRDGEVSEALEAGQYVYVDVDNEGIPLGIELLFAGRLMTTNDLATIMVNLGQLSGITENVPVEA
jgi:uncharacterized protein YuzE